jgi:hypothetical protein
LRITLVVLVVLGLASYAWWRVRRAALTRLEQEVRAVAELEMRALVNEDFELYASLQDPVDSRRLAARQAQVLSGAALPPPAPGLVATLPITIENPRVVGDRARVEIVRLAGWPDGDQFPFRAVAFYRLTADGRWVHTSPDPEYGGRILVWVGPRNDLAAHIIHAELTERLAPELEITAQDFCELVSCPADVRFTLTLTGTLDVPASRPEVFPALHLVGVPEGEEAKAIWIEAMQGILVDTMVARLLGESTGGLIGSGLRTWVEQALGIAPPHDPDPSLLTEALSEGHVAGLDSLWEGVVPDQWREIAEEEVALFIDYVEREYGREGVISLLRGSRGASSLDALLRAALDVDLAAFERGWLEYLEAEITRQVDLSHLGSQTKPGVA